MRNKPIAVVPYPHLFQSKSSMIPSLFLLRHSTQGKGKGGVGRVSAIKVYGDLEV
jgi:hypothetical protein